MTSRMKSYFFGPVPLAWWLDAALAAREAKEPAGTLPPLALADVDWIRLSACTVMGVGALEAFLLDMGSLSL